MTKLCIDCGETKPLDDFPKAGGGRYKVRCKPCYNIYQAIQRNRPERQVKIRRSWKEASAKYYTTENRRNKTLRAYGLTEQDYNRMYDEQNGLCAICQQDLRLVVDHCHNSNTVRALLCNQCNLGLGAFYDDVDRLQSAIVYLNKHAR